jgi:hypothetical protein
VLAAQIAFAATINADPTDYQTKADGLVAGDTLVLAAGSYPDGLDLFDLAGTSALPITITGPASGTATFLGDTGVTRNTIEIRNSSYLVIKDLTIDGQDVAGIDGIKAGGGATDYTHHIRIEGCTIIGHGGSQQTVGISTKCNAWGWEIVGNVIEGAGTGLYLGNSDGTMPFVGGLIEGNRVYDPEGYCMEIKHQDAWPSTGGFPSTDAITTIRHNVWIKTDRASGSGDRPSVLVGGFPESGTGSGSHYEIYGNLFASNPRESLLQCCGRVAIHDNLFVGNLDQSAIYLSDHSGHTLKDAWIYTNSINDGRRGINFINNTTGDDPCVGNLIFTSSDGSALGIRNGTPGTQVDNVIAAAASAATYVVTPGTTLGFFDFYPKTGQCQGSALDLSAFASHADHDRDFNGDDKGGFLFRGCYAGEQPNPGWQPDNTNKPVPAPPGPLAIVSSATMAAATVAVPISRSLTASGGTAPYLWTLDGGSTLPPGVSLNSGGGISGVPTVEGSYSFGVTVTDALLATDQRTFSIDIVSGSCGCGGGGPDPDPDPDPTPPKKKRSGCVMNPDAFDVPMTLGFVAALCACAVRARRYFTGS